MGFHDATIYAKVALPWIIVGFLFHLIGFPTDAWIDTNGGNVGLFKICGDSLGCNSVDHSTSPSWYQTSLAFEILGFIFLLATVVISLVYILVMTNNTIMTIVGIVCNSTAIFFIFVGFVVYAGRYGELWSETLFDLGWSFALVIIAFICIFVGLICQFLDLCLPYQSRKRLPNPHV